MALCGLPTPLSYEVEAMYITAVLLKIRSDVPYDSVGMVNSGQGY